MDIKVLEWTGSKLVMLDQTKLPGEETYMEIDDPVLVVDSIKTLKVRGAPAIGIAAAYGLALYAVHSETSDPEEFIAGLRKTRDLLASSRPTAVNLFWALDRVVKKAEGSGVDDTDSLRDLVVNEAVAIDKANLESDLALSRYGKELIQDGDKVLTYCNSGALATAGYGTALGIVRAAWESGKKVHLYACETRPLFQGARLTMWECKKTGIPATLIVDGAAGSLIAQGKINKIFVGADRVAANGDTANKIGTYTVAALASLHLIPFYVAAPVSTLDVSTNSGQDIEVEERAADEVTHVMGRRIAPDGVSVENPAFDVTPGSLISAIITDKGVLKPPYAESLKTV